MRYISTRDIYGDVSFKDTLFNGLAKDSGLFIPINIPQVNLSELEDIFKQGVVTSDSKLYGSKKSFIDIAFYISRLYIDRNEISDNDLKDIMTRSFTTFRSELVAPLVKLNLKNKDTAPLYVLELFHGPTFAFKDIALQVLGNLFAYFLDKQKESNSSSKKLTIVCATSGDTGGAAIYSVKGKKNINCYVLHPKNKISNIQKAQMTTIYNSNIHNIEIDGTFDDCQTIVKDLFKDTEFKNKVNLSTFNSINWARIMVQITYYFYSYFQIKNYETDIDLNKLQFSVPTGNFGDILAGFYAKKMGLPVNKLIIATNENDILYRFINEGGVYQPVMTIQTLSPAMDITISSNFERLLWYFKTEDSDIKFFMNNLLKNGFFNVSNNMLNEIKKVFASEKVNNKEILDTIKQIKNDTDYLIDPHTAVGICSFIKNNTINNNITISLSTAHPGKFPDIVNEVLDNKERNNFVPEILKDCLSLEQKYISFDMNKNILSNIKNYIINNSES